MFSNFLKKMRLVRKEKVGCVNKNGFSDLFRHTLPSSFLLTPFGPHQQGFPRQLLRPEGVKSNKLKNTKTNTPSSLPSLGRTEGHPSYSVAKLTRDGLPSLKIPLRCIIYTSKMGVKRFFELTKFKKWNVKLVNPCIPSPEASNSILLVLLGEAGL